MRGALFKLQLTVIIQELPILTVVPLSASINELPSTIKVCVIYRGRRLVDTCAGTQGPVDPRPVTPSTLFCAFSAGKAVCSTAIHVLADHGLLKYDQKLIELWPEFGKEGKENTTVSPAFVLPLFVESLQQAFSRHSLDL